MPDSATDYLCSIIQELTEEERQQLVEDWTKHGRIVVENRHGTPFAGDPDPDVMEGRY